MVLLEVLLSDAMVQGQGGVHHLAVILSDDDVIRFLSMVYESRKKTSPLDDFVFLAPPAVAIDVRLVVAAIPVLDDEVEDDGGGGEEVEPPESDRETEGHKHHHFRRRVIPEA